MQRLLPSVVDRFDCLGLDLFAIVLARDALERRHRSGIVMAIAEGLDRFALDRHVGCSHAIRVNASTTPAASMSPSVSTASCCAVRFGCVFAIRSSSGKRGRVAQLAERLDGFAQHIFMFARRDDALDRRRRARSAG